jgi:hypothetical protein
MVALIEAHFKGIEVEQISRLPFDRVIIDQAHAGMC